MQLRKCTAVALVAAISATHAMVTYANTWQEQFQNNAIEKVIPAPRATLALNSDGELWGWTLHIGGYLNSLHRKIMDDVAYVVDVGLTTFAITKDGGLYSWGSNGSGSLGDGTNIDSRNTPARIMDDVAWPTFKKFWRTSGSKTRYITCTKCGHAGYCVEVYAKNS